MWDWSQVQWSNPVVLQYEDIMYLLKHTTRHVDPTPEIECHIIWSLLNSRRSFLWMSIIAATATYPKSFLSRSVSQFPKELF
jgi:hypothetical protein